MSMKGLGGETPMAIRNAASNPKARGNVAIKGQVSQQKGNPNGRSEGIKNAASKPRGR